MSEWEFKTLDSYLKNGKIFASRGDVISKIDIGKFPGNYPIYSSSAQKNGKFGEYGKFMFDEELITWSVDGGGNFFHRPKHKFSVTNVCGYLRVIDKEIDPLFLFYSLDDQHSRLNFDYQSKAHPSVIRKLYSIPKIDKLEQLKIAQIVKALDTQIEQTEALIAKQENIRQGLMQDLFTRGVDETGQLRPAYKDAPHLYHETELGWLPKGWKVKPFGADIDVIDPNPSHRYPEPVEEGVLICSTENFDGYDGLNFRKSKHVELKTYFQQNLRCNFHPDDVLFARKGRIGLARRHGLGKKVFSHTIVIFKSLSDLVNQKWLLWLSRSNEYLLGIEREMNSNSGVPTLGVEFIKSIDVPRPKPDEQERIAEILDYQSKTLNIKMDELQKLKKQKAGLMRDLLSSDVSVAPLMQDETA